MPATQAHKPALRENAVFAYIIAAMLMFASAFWASILPVQIYGVIALMTVPSLLLGYYFAPVFNKYILGLLIGICAYMAMEYLLYGPIYRVTGPVYASAYLFATASVLLARWLYIRRVAARFA